MEARDRDSSVVEHLVRVSETYCLRWRKGRYCFVLFDNAGLCCESSFLRPARLHSQFADWRRPHPFLKTKLRFHTGAISVGINPVSSDKSTEPNERGPKTCLVHPPHAWASRRRLQTASTSCTDPGLSAGWGSAGFFVFQPGASRQQTSD